MYVYPYTGIIFSLEKGGNAGTTTRMNPKDIMLSEISPSQKDEYCMIPLTGRIKGVKFTGTQSRMMLDQGLGRKKKKGVTVE